MSIHPAAAFCNSIHAFFCLCTAAHVPLFLRLYTSCLKPLACHQGFSDIIVSRQFNAYFAYLHILGFRFCWHFSASVVVVK